MRTLRVNNSASDPSAVAEAVAVLAKGGVIAFPTETVYGLAVDASNPEAVRRMYAVKGRDARKLCALLLPDRAAAERHAPPLPPFASRLADRFWPGPLTLIVPGHDGETVGFRLPDAPIALALARAAGHPLLQTSANRSGEPAGLNAAAVASTLGTEVDLILDGGRCPLRVSSTVVRCDAARYAILRQGAVSAQHVVEAASDLTLLACTGNLCRSPMAEAFLRQEAAEELGCAPEELVWHGHRFGSFGVLAAAGMPPTEETIRAAKEMGADVSAHRSRPFALDLVASARRVVTLARNHQDFLLPYFVDRPDDLLALRPDGRDVADPMGKSLATYRRVAKEIREACRARAQELFSRKESSA
ncbi:MAG: L-threonylcarbamoyladenylate synthase [Planctomycetaceae bacterium]